MDGWVSEFEIGIRSAMDREESKKTSDRFARSGREVDLREDGPAHSIDEGAW